MYVVVGWPPHAKLSRTLATQVMNLCATVRRRNDLHGALMGLPPADDERGRQRVFAILQSLRSSGLSSAGVMISLDQANADAIDECLSAGIADLVFVNDRHDVRESLAIVSASRLPAMPDARVRLWLTQAARGQYQRHMAAWKSAFDFRVEVAPAPFALDVPPGNGAAVSGRGEVDPIACEWQRSVVCVAGEGTVHACPAHSRSTDRSMAADAPDIVLATLATWRASLNDSPICRDCDRPPRFGIADWLGPQPPPEDTALPAARKYRDHVGRNALAAMASELDRLIEEFATRVEESSGPNTANDAID